MALRKMAWRLAVLGLWLLAPGLARAQWMGNAAGGHGCGSCKVPCPPKFIWYSEGPPRIKFKCACPKPVCDPCNLEHAGYFPTCWTPWPYPPDWSHCPSPPPAAVLPPPAVPPYAPRIAVPRTDRPATRPAERPREERPDPELDMPRSLGRMELPPAEEQPVIRLEERPLPQPEKRPAVRLVR